ncbi:O-antigen ligase family protein [Sphingobium bisphenolivorans]|uniref:O-antigen ligase family protein n=1 Tax=Sphingobium bisphenolivorans TaxID=1335760 RepID=UPI000399F1AC|nr:O-antigen ligase family protein [Sphingobium bisphenolivorans]
MQSDYYQASQRPSPALRPPGDLTGFGQDWSNELHRWEFILLQGAVFFAPYIAFHHPAVYFTLGDALFAGAFLLRLCTGRMAPLFADLTWLWLLALLMLTGGLFIGSVVNGDMVRCVTLVSQYCFAYLIVPMVLLRRSEAEVIRLIKCGIWGMTAMCGIGALIYMSGYTSLSNDQMTLVTGGRRLAGFVDNPNAMAVLTVMTLPLVWFLLLSRQMKPVTGLLCTGMLVTGIILTSSNTGIYTLAAATLIFLGGRQHFKTLILVACLAGAVMVFGQDYLPQTFQHRVLSAMNSGDLAGAGTFEYRQQLNIEALNFADDHLIIGMGADQYRFNSQYGLPVHNTYLLMLNEGGALSLLGYLLVLSVPVIAGAVARQLPHGRLVLLTTVTIVLVFANATLGVPHVYGRAWFLSIFLAVSPALIWYGPTRRVPASTPMTRRPVRGAAPPSRA